jgi:hypothetical protein
MTVTNISSPYGGQIGLLHDIDCKEENSILIFQLPRSTKMISPAYIEEAQKALQGSLPKGRTALVVGCDVNVYELAEADSIILKLKGLI